MRSTEVAARWALITVFVGGIAVGFALGATPGRNQLLVISVAVYAGVGWLVTSRKADNPIGWLFLTVAAMTGLGALADGMTRHALAAGDPASWLGRWGAWLHSWFWFPLFCCATLFTLLLFPDGLPSRRWRSVLWTSIATCLLLTAATSLATEVSVGDTKHSATGVCPAGQTLRGSACGHFVDNPLGVPPTLGDGSWGESLAVVLVAILAICFFLAVLSVVLRYRRSSGTLRLQMRWFVFAAVIVAAWMVISALAVKGDGDPLWSEIVLALVIALIPLSCGIAILRYHLYDIDRVISRTASYAIVTGLVLAVYAVIVTSASRVLHSNSPLVVAGATLAAAALVRPALRRVQVVVDRRFDRARYDGARTVDEFGGRLQHTIDVEIAQSDLLRTVQESLQPATAAVWVNGGTT
jgi:hypothetical protein